MLEQTDTEWIDAANEAGQQDRQQCKKNSNGDKPHDIKEPVLNLESDHVVVVLFGGVKWFNKAGHF